MILSFLLLYTHIIPNFYLPFQLFITPPEQISGILSNILF